MKTVALGDFLTNEEIKKLTVMANRYDPLCLEFVDDIENTILIPNMDRINTSIGQENSSRYLAYAIAYILHRTR